MIALSPHRALRRWLAAALIGIVASAALAQSAGRLAAIGDSLTDEYAEEWYAYARAWTEILTIWCAVDMGPTAAQAGRQSWGEPRRTRFQDNWARGGATTDSAIAAGQHTGVADGVASRHVTHAVMYIGGNDIALAYSPIYNAAWDQDAIDAYLAGRIANYRTILDTVSPTGVHLVLAAVMDFSAMPWIQANYPDPHGRDRVTAAVARFRDAARELAREYGLVFVDAFEFNRTLWGDNHTPREVLLVGNTPIYLRQADGGGAPDRGWVGDGVHPSTIIQAIWADLFATALNACGAGIGTMNEETLLATARLPYGGSDTLTATLGAFSDYVTDYGCRPCDTNCDGSVNALDIAGFADALNGSPSPCSPCIADANYDGSINGLDIAPFVACLMP